jgi:hypothetical protein
MADDVDATLRETQATIAKTEAVLKEAQEALEKGEKLRQENNVSGEKLHAFIAAQSAEAQAEFAKEAQAIQDEIERELPKQQPAARQTRVRPGRQMI